MCVEEEGYEEGVCITCKFSNVFFVEMLFSPNYVHINKVTEVHRRTITFNKEILSFSLTSEENTPKMCMGFMAREI